MKKQIDALNKRNRRVEIDKAWETSKTRRIIIACLTYVTISTFLIIINIPKPWLNAVVPTLGFMLSTLSMPIFKKFWVQQIYRK